MTKSVSLKIAATLTLAALLLSAPVVHAHPDEEVTTPSTAVVTTAGEAVESISGGIGEEGRAELEAVQKNYDLKVVFAGEGGIFLDDIHAVITDAAKNTVLTTDPEGPILLVNLKPGKYVVTAEAQGIVQKATISIKKNRLTNITLRFPIGE